MVFSIFKKNKSDQQNSPQVSAHRNAAGAPAVAPAPAPAPSTIPMAYAHDDLGIEVCSGSDMLSPAEEQAAMSYANGQVKDAQAVLQAEISAIKGQRRLDTWLMLFELFQQTNQRSAFDELSLEFVTEFEKTPPIWRTLRAAEAAPTATAGSHIFGAKLTDATIKRELENYKAAAAKNANLRLDLGRVAEIDTLAAVELLAAWQHNRKPGQIPQLSGWQSFVRLLSTKIAVGRREPVEAPFWMLLTEVYQSLGQQEEFENLAIDYAVTFEVSPPSWDARFAPKTAIREVEKPAETSQNHSEGQKISGNLTADHASAVNEIREYVKTGASTLVLDFSRVDRIDFDSAGQLLNIAMAVLQEGKTLTIRQCNELVLAMLRIMSITDMAQVERRKS